MIIRELMEYLAKANPTDQVQLLVWHADDDCEAGLVTEDVCCSLGAVVGCVLLQGPGEREEMPDDEQDEDEEEDDDDIDHDGDNDDCFSDDEEKRAAAFKRIFEGDDASEEETAVSPQT